jgi:hypothetical protein
MRWCVVYELSVFECRAKKIWVAIFDGAEKNRRKLA